MARPRLPSQLRWLFWEVDFDALDPDRHAAAILARILERGRMADVQWAIGFYGMERIHRFLRETGSPELSDRTVTFWRAVFKAEDEKWASPPAWRRDRSAPSIG